jgi:hypothetical protein
LTTIGEVREVKFEVPLHLRDSPEISTGPLEILQNVAVMDLVVGELKVPGGFAF